MCVRHKIHYPDLKSDTEIMLHAMNSQYTPDLPRPVPLWMRVYSWHMVVVGVGGGVLSFVNAVMSVEEKLQEGSSCWTTWF